MLLPRGDTSAKNHIFACGDRSVALLHAGDTCLYFQMREHFFRIFWFIRFGAKKGLCPMPEMSRLHFGYPKVDSGKTENMTPDQMQAYLEALDEEPDQQAAAFLRLALATGLRKNALLSLRWDDVDFEFGFITLRGEVAKKGKSERIPFSAAAKSILKSIDRTTSEYIFPGKDGGPRREFKKIAKRVKENAGLPEDFRPLHGLRHTFASWLASSGEVDLYTLQRLLTHNSPQMTQRYAHLADSALQRAAAVTDKLFSPVADAKPTIVKIRKKTKA